MLQEYCLPAKAEYSHFYSDFKVNIRADILRFCRRKEISVVECILYVNGVEFSNFGACHTHNFLQECYTPRDDLALINRAGGPMMGES